MSTSFIAREDLLRNPLTEKQRLEAEAAADGGPAVSAETMQALLVAIDSLRLEVCDWQSQSEREARGHYVGPSAVADDRGWSYLYPVE